jgi:large subunit ribosomal protein L20
MFVSLNVLNVSNYYFLLVKLLDVARKRRKKILAIASGYRGAHSVLFRIANQQVMKALRYSYVGRKQKKRIFRRIWISRINAASRLNGTSYSQLIHKFKKSNIDLNRKMLSQIAVLDSSTFKSLSNF